MLEVKMNKKSLRKKYIQLRENIPAEKREEDSKLIFEQLRNEQIYQDSQVIFVFVSFENEINTHNFILRALEDGKTICAPLVVSSSELVAYQITNFSELEKDKFGILSPNPNKAKKILPEEIDLAIVPLLAFNKDGYRLGYGKGYYDQYLPKLNSNCKKIGVAFSTQFAESLPVEIYDYPLNKILTETGFFPLTKRVETHAHSAEFSFDCNRKFDELILEANQKNYAYLTLTDHYDKDVMEGQVVPPKTQDYTVVRKNEWAFSVPEYIDFCVKKKKELKENPNSTQLLTGIELGYQAYLIDFYQTIIEQFPFDCVIGSIHTMNMYDFAVIGEPLYGQGKQKAYASYLKTLIEMTQSKLDFDILAHFDYVTRYAPYADPYFYYQDFPELFDQLFREIINRNICLEVNTRTRYGSILAGDQDWGIADLNIYKRYYELGGRMICFATDAHQPGNLQMLISDSMQKMREIGFTKGTYFVNRKPQFYDL